MTKIAKILVNHKEVIRVSVKFELFIMLYFDLY